jgi:4-amino-4-deoxy-L-arabinose transferase-like glycosyltransferase
MLKKIKSNYMILILIGFYFVTHLPSLVELPVFADESIYIRWAQLIIDDWKRYLFFPMNDGKTPLFIWILVPFQFLFKNQLFAGRIVSLLVGLVQVLVNIKTIEVLGGRKKTKLVVGLLTIVLPFWYFQHRMALMDGLLTLFSSFTFLTLLKVFKKQKSVVLTKENFIKNLFDKSSMKLLLFAGLSFGLAILTKIPAVLFIPSFYLSIFFISKKDFSNLFLSFFKVSLSMFVGLVIFGLLKINPVFGQLFSRGGDFLFPISEIIGGKWKETIPNIPNYINYFFVYLTPGIMIASIVGLFSKKHKTIIHILFWSGVSFILPIALMGKTVYPRYLFPASFFFTLASAISLEGIIVNAFNKNNKLWSKILVSIIVSLLISNTITSSINFINFSIFNPNATPFVSSDKTQYLMEWSSGHGIKETVELIEAETELTTLAVATEGYFGTLPDALLMYLHDLKVDNLYLEGVGYPIEKIPKSFADRASNFDKKWLVVNSHRMNLKLDQKYLVAEYSRPFGAPALQIWDITENFESYIK